MDDGALEARRKEDDSSEEGEKGVGVGVEGEPGTASSVAGLEGSDGSGFLMVEVEPPQTGGDGQAEQGGAESLPVNTIVVESGADGEDGFAEGDEHDESVAFHEVSTAEGDDSGIQWRINAAIQRAHVTAVGVNAATRMRPGGAEVDGAESSHQTRDTPTTSGWSPTIRTPLTRPCGADTERVSSDVFGRTLYGDGSEAIQRVNDMTADALTSGCMSARTTSALL